MKLTLAQITTITFALAEAAVKHQERADRAPGGTFWKEESDSASQLHDLFKDALSVEVESVQLNKPALEKPLKDKMTALASHYLEAHSQAAAELEIHEPDSPTAQGALCTTTDATTEKLDDLWGGPKLRPRREKRANTSHAAKPAEATNLSSPALPAASESSAPAAPPARTGAQAPHDAASVLNAPTSTPAAHGLPADNLSACGEAESLSSFAEPTDACGDINCDGHCLPAAPHDPRPSLIKQIDACGSVNDARIAVANAPASALRRAARHLRTDLHSLPGEISRRVRARLLEQL